MMGMGKNEETETLHKITFVCLEFCFNRAGETQL